MSLNFEHVLVSKTIRCGQLSVINQHSNKIRRIGISTLVYWNTNNNYLNQWMLSTTGIDKYNENEILNNLMTGLKVIEKTLTKCCMKTVQFFFVLSLTITFPKIMLSFGYNCGDVFSVLFSPFCLGPALRPYFFFIT